MKISNFKFQIVALGLAAGALFGATEPISVNTADGKVKQTSSGVGAIGKPFDFSLVSTTGISGGGGGLTGAGNLAPLFTSGVVGSTINFTLSTAAAHTFLGNNTAGVAAPAYVQPDFTDLSGSATDAQVPNTLTLSTISNLTTNGFIKTTGGTGALSIDTNVVIGPASNTNLAYALFNGTTGKLLQDSTLTADGAGTLYAHHLASAVNALSATIDMRSNYGGGAPSLGFGNSLDVYMESSTTDDQQAGRLGWAWSDITHGTRTSYLDFWLVNNAATWATKMRLFGSGGLSVNSTTDPGAGWINANTGFKIGGTNIIGSSVEAWDTQLDSLAGLSYTGNALKVVRVNAGENAFELAAASGGSPGGSNTQVQYNNSSTFGGITNATTDGTTLTLTSPKIVTNIKDTNANTLLGITATASAVNSLTVANAATLNSPVLSASGSDTDISLVLQAKGSNGSKATLGNFNANAAGLLIDGTGINGTILSLNNTSVGGINWQFTSQGSGNGQPGHFAFFNGTNTILDLSGTLIGTYASGKFAWWSDATYAGAGSVDTGLARDAAGGVQVNNGTAGQWGYLKSGVRDAGTATVTNGLTVGHQSTGTPAADFGSGILFNANTTTTADVNAGQIGVAWSTATHATHASYMDFLLNTAGGANTSKMRLFGSGALSVGSTTDPASTGVINAGTGFRVNNAASSGTVLQGGSGSFAPSVATWPTATTAGYKVQGNGTNYVAYPTGIINSSVTTVSAGYSSDTYLAGSAVTVAAGDWKVNGVYHCRFDMTKTAAGTATPIISVRMGTLGTTGDTAVGTITFAAGTAAADTGTFDVDVVFRTVGSGTSAVVQMMGVCNHHLAATGLTSTGASGTGIIVGTSSGFASTTQTKLGLSFNGGTSFAGTNTIATAVLNQP